MCGRCRVKSRTADSARLVHGVRPGQLVDWRIRHGPCVTAVVRCHMPQVCPKPKLALVTPGNSRFPTPLGPSAGRDVVSQVPSVDKLHVRLFLDAKARCSVPSRGQRTATRGSRCPNRSGRVRRHRRSLQLRPRPR
jgi:hypothetical protein